MKNAYKKKFFVFYKLYDTILEELSNDKKKIIFFNELRRCQFSTECTSSLVSNVVFNDVELDEQWNRVIQLLTKRDRNTKEYIEWRKSVLKRDNFKCVLCESIKNLEVHHIVRWIDSVELRYELDNGILLCSDCHNKVHSGDISL